MTQTAAMTEQAISSQQATATVTDHVTYRPGDGAPLVIPQGPVEVELTADSAILSWTAENGAAGLAAIPLTLYDEYVRQGRILPPSGGSNSR